MAASDSCLLASGVQVEALQVLECPRRGTLAWGHSVPAHWTQIWLTKGKSNLGHTPLPQKRGGNRRWLRQNSQKATEEADHSALLWWRTPVFPHHTHITPQAPPHTGAGGGGPSHAGYSWLRREALCQPSFSWVGGKEMDMLGQPSFRGHCLLRQVHLPTAH